MYVCSNKTLAKYPYDLVQMAYDLTHCRGQDSNYFLALSRMIQEALHNTVIQHLYTKS